MSGVEGFVSGLRSVGAERAVRYWGSLGIAIDVAGLDPVDQVRAIEDALKADGRWDALREAAGL